MIDLYARYKEDIIMARTFWRDRAVNKEYKRKFPINLYAITPLSYYVNLVLRTQ